MKDKIKVIYFTVDGNLNNQEMTSRVNIELAKLIEDGYEVLHTDKTIHENGNVIFEYRLELTDSSYEADF